MLRTLFFCDDLTIPDAHALLTPIGLQGAFRFKVERYADVVVDRAVGQRTAGPGQARQARAL